MACCRKKSVKEKYFSHRTRRGFGDVEVEHACQYLLFFFCSSENSDIFTTAVSYGTL